jgi:hypothetical protein
MQLDKQWLQMNRSQDEILTAVLCTKRLMATTSASTTTKLAIPASFLIVATLP